MVKDAELNRQNTELSKLSDADKKRMMDMYFLSEMPTAQDKFQTILTEKGVLPNPNTFAKVFFRDKIKGKNLICPFCLEIAPFSHFKYVKGYYECETCKNKMTEKTLDNMFNIFNQEKINVKGYVAWVYGYRLTGFFDKIMLHVKQETKDSRFIAFNKKLRELGINYEFWEEYKKLKGEKKE